jgi:hypothetical protein
MKKLEKVKWENLQIIVKDIFKFSNFLWTSNYDVKTKKTFLVSDIDIPPVGSYP